MSPATVALSGTSIDLASRVTGGTLYAASGSMYQYSAGGAGALAAMSPATVAAGTTPYYLAMRSLGPAPADLRAVPALSTTGTLTWKVSFNRPVTGLAAGDFSLGAAAGSWAVTGVTGSGAGPYTVTATGTGTGTETLTMASGAVADPAGNTGPQVTTAASSVAVTAGSVLPTIPATSRVGLAQAGTAGTWVGADNTYAYQWQVADSDLGPWTNATGTGNATLTYTPVAGDAWKRIRLKVTATNAAGSTDAVAVSGLVQVAPQLLVANAGSATVGRYPIAVDGSLGTTTTIAAGTGTKYPVVTPDGAFAYVINTTAATISQYSVDSAGALTALSGTAPAVGADARHIVITPNGRFVYVSNGSANTISQFVRGGDGQLASITTAIAAGSGTTGLMVNPAGTVLYAASRTGNQLIRYSINQSTGALTQLGTTTVATDPTFGAITPDGACLFVASNSSGKVSAFSIAGDGALTAGTVTTVTSAQGVAISADGGSLYVNTWASPGVVQQYTIGASCALTAKSPPSVAVQNSSYPGVLGVNGQALYVPNSASNTISQFSRVAGTGVVSPMTPATVANGSTTFGLALLPSAPGVALIQQVPALGNAAALSWKVTFNRPVTGVEASDFSLGGAAGSWSITGVTGSGAGPYTVTAAGTGAGTETLTLAAGSVTDPAGTTGPAVARSAVATSISGASSLPTIPATVRVGLSSTGTAGTWVGEGAATSYQWEVSADGATGWTNAAGAGATTLTFTPAAADAYKFVRLTVTATNAAGSSTASSTTSFVTMPDLLVASNTGGNSVSVLPIGSGGLLAAGTTTTGLNSPRHPDATPDGRFLYVPNFGATTVSQYAVSDTGTLTALSAVFGTGPAVAINEYVGQTYNDAANAIASSGQSAVISSRFGTFLPTGACIVSGSRSASFLDSGGNSTSKVLLDLNCNYMFALPGVPGNSLGSPEGRTARAAAEEQYAEQQAKLKAEAEAQAAAEASG